MDSELYYSCQVKVPRFEKQGQSLLAQSKCLVVGMGGLGCPVSLYLAVSGVGTIGICDVDTIELSNISRQILYTPSEIGEKKVEVAQKKLQTQNPFIKIEAHDTVLNEANWDSLLSAYDIIIDCTDNFHSKFLIHDACLLKKKNLVQAGIYQTSGQLYYFPFARRTSPCLRCLWENMPSLENQSDCSMAGVMASLAGIVGLQQVNVVLLSLLGKDKDIASMQIYNWDSMTFMPLMISRKEHCPCDNEQEKKKITNDLYNDALEIRELPAESDENVAIFDVRNEQDQQENAKFGKRKAISLPKEGLANFEAYIASLDNKATYILVCYRGIRSLQLTKIMRSKGFNACSLSGGYTKL